MSVIRFGWCGMYRKVILLSLLKFRLSCFNGLCLSWCKRYKAIEEILLPQLVGTQTVASPQSVVVNKESNSICPLHMQLQGNLHSLFVSLLLFMSIWKSVPSPVRAIHTVRQTVARQPAIRVIPSLSGHFCHSCFPPKLTCSHSLPLFVPVH